MQNLSYGKKSDAMSKLGFLDKRVIRPTEKITAEEERKIDLKIEELKEYL